MFTCSHHTVHLLLHYNRLAREAQKQQLQSATASPGPTKSQTELEKQQPQIDAVDSQTTSLSSPASRSPVATPDTTDSSTTENKTNFQPIHIILDLRDGGDRFSTIIRGVSPVMTSFILSLMKSCLDCHGLDYGAKGVKLYGNHREGVKKVLTEKLQVPTEAISTHILRV